MHTIGALKILLNNFTIQMYGFESKVVLCCDARLPIQKLLGLVPLLAYFLEYSVKTR